MKIGLPRALLTYYYYPFWKTMFSELGAEVVLSDETNSKIISEGATVTVSELCVPIKIFNGHLLNLLEKDVDFIFLPRFVKMKREWYCPKFIGIGEIADYSIPGLLEKQIEVKIKSDNDVIDNIDDYKEVMEKLHVSKKDLKKALKKASQKFNECRELSKLGYTMSEVFDIFDGKECTLNKREEPITIALLGYVNNVYDNFVSMNAISKLRSMGVNVLTFDMVDEDKLQIRKGKEKSPFWVFARKIYNASLYFTENKMIDGIIHITAFGCGPDSVIGKMMELNCEDENIPFMTLRVDEHTGESHVQTRLEAFIDMLKMKKV